MAEDQVALDRVAGVLVGTACGDALGAGYEFRSALPHEVPVAMVGGGSFGWEPGEWTDDASVILGPVNASGALPSEVDAVVSLCRVEYQHLPSGVVRPEDQVQIWLIDKTEEPT